MISSRFAAAPWQECRAAADVSALLTPHLVTLRNVPGNLAVAVIASRLDSLDHLDRGYDRMAENLAAFGADIVRSDGNR